MEQQYLILCVTLIVGIAFTLYYRYKYINVKKELEKLKDKNELIIDWLSFIKQRELNLNSKFNEPVGPPSAIAESICD